MIIQDCYLYEIQSRSSTAKGHKAHRAGKLQEADRYYTTI